MDYAQMKAEKAERLEKYKEEYAEQLRLKGYIASLEKDNESLGEAEPTTFRGKRQVKKLIKINQKDIDKYNKMLNKMPAVPEFK
jgi:ribosomal protein S8